MIKIFLSVSFFLCVYSAASQFKNNNPYLNSDSSFNALLFHRLNKIVDWEKYVAINSVDVTFIKFVIRDKKIDSIVFTGEPPYVIVNSFKIALNSTAHLWKETKETFILPIVYIFEQTGTNPENKSPAGIVNLLRDVYQDKQPQIAGSGIHPPLKCVLLSPYFIHAVW